MTSGPKRTRSNTSGSTSSGRPRPISRASTASLNTTAALPPEQQRPLSESTYPAPDHHHPSQYTSRELLAHSSHQLAGSHYGYAVDSSVPPHSNVTRAMSVDHVYTRPNDEMKSVLQHQNSFDQSGVPHFTAANFQDEQTQDESGTGDMRKKKGSASSIANDQELRRLFAENKHRDLKDVASAVLANERGPRSEKTKQIFAMNWLNTVCKKSSTSVPRNRVFSHYATRCGTERVPPLNPASFGKLVRIIFPGIQTRRLGMRGESKYHYVDLALVDDQSGYRTGDYGVSYVGETIDDRRPRGQLPADTAVFPSPNIPLDAQSAHRFSAGNAPGCLYLNPNLPNLHQGPSGPNMVRRQLKFPTQQETPQANSEPIELPNVKGFLPAGTDLDAADALVALYRTHCVSVIDCFRFCKEKMFWHHFTSFHGTLTVPVQKLLAHPDLAPWVTECDWLMYQRMIRFVSPLALQVMPPKIIETFRSISVRLSGHINNTFSNHPQHVRDAKLGPATVFAGLIDRLLRVNATAHAAANILTNDVNRDQMWYDWVYCVRPVSAAESSLPSGGYTRTIQILSNDVRELLGPLRAISYQGMQPIYASAASSNYSPHSNAELDDSSTSGVLDRWTTFLHELPSRFPGVDARTILHCAGEVTSAALRDITMATASSFGSWWVTKVWVDEMLQWLAETGGFLENSPSSVEMRPKKRTASDAFAVDEMRQSYRDSRPPTRASDLMEGPSRFGSVDPRNEFHNIQKLAQTQPQQAHAESQTQQPALSQSPAAAGVANVRPPSRPTTPRAVSNGGVKQYTREKSDQIQSHDDSGIGMDFELPQQTPIRLTDYGGFVASGVNSDPADVIVC